MCIHSLEPEEEKAAPTATEEVLPRILEDLSPSKIIAQVLGTLEAKEEVAEPELGDDGRDQTTCQSMKSRRTETKKRIRKIIRSKGLQWWMFRRQGWTKRK